MSVRQLLRRGGFCVWGQPAEQTVLPLLVDFFLRGTYWKCSHYLMLCSNFTMHWYICHSCCIRSGHVQKKVDQTRRPWFVAKLITSRHECELSERVRKRGRPLTMGIFGRKISCCNRFRIQKSSFLKKRLLCIYFILMRPSYWKSCSFYVSSLDRFVLILLRFQSHKGKISEKLVTCLQVRKCLACPWQGAIRCNPNAESGRGITKKKETVMGPPPHPAEASA